MEKATRHSSLRRTLVIVPLAVLWSAPPVAAGVLVTVTSIPANLETLNLGEPVTVAVTLSGLVAGDELTLLSTRVEFSSSILGTPTVLPGAILPDPLDSPFDFTFIEDPGSADATFLTFSAATAAHIVENGTFFEFILHPQAVGEGTIQIVLADAQQVDPEDPGNLITPSITLGEPLSYTVVPEPSSMLLALPASFILLAFARRLRR